jgi:hypothetical protein
MFESVSRSPACRLPLVLLASLALAAILAASAQGAGWTAAQDISGEFESSKDVEVASDANGDAFAVWDHLGIGTSTQVIESAIHPAGGAWQAPVTIPGAEGFTPQLAVSPAGEVVAVWETMFDGGGVIMAAVKAAGGEWQTPVRLSPEGDSSSEAQVAIGADGVAAAVWDQGAKDNEPVVEAAVHQPGSTWTGAQTLSHVFGAPSDTHPATPQVAVDAQGRRPRCGPRKRARSKRRCTRAAGRGRPRSNSASPSRAAERASPNRRSPRTPADGR